MMAVEQDGLIAGEIELNHIFFYDNLSIKEQIEESDYLIQEILKVYRGKREHIHIKKDTEPLICFYNTFIVRLNALVQEEVIDSEWISNLTKKFIINGVNDYEIKLGLILSEQYLEYDELEKVIDDFASKAEYIFYLSNSIKRIKKYNTWLLELAKKSEGVIKVFAVTNLENIDEKINIYLIEQGYKDNKYQQLLTDYVCTNMNVKSYLKRNVSEEKINKLSLLLYNYLKNMDFCKISIKEEILNNFLPVALNNRKSIYCLYSLFYILKGLEEDDESHNNEEIVSNLKCQLNDDKWKNVFFRSIKEMVVESEDLISAAEFYNYNFSFEELYPYLLSDKDDFDVYFYFMKNGSKQDNLKLLKFFTENFDMVQLTGNIRDIDKNQLTEKYIADLLFAVVIKASRDLYPQGKIIAMMGILGNINDVRKESIAVLKKYRDKLSEKDMKVIHKVFKAEPNNELKKSITGLINDNNYIKREVMKIDDIKVQPHVKDIYLFSTDIAGVQYIDKEGLDEEFTEHNICFLAQEKDNLYDKKAIKVITDHGFVIGYVPRQVNFVLSNLLSSGKYLYCRIKEYDLSRDYIRIRIYLSYKDTLDQLEDAIKMFVVNDQSDFIN